MYTECRLCARSCGANRSEGKAGFCKMTDKIYIAGADLHFFEEPPISGTRGSGTVFFVGCSLGCIYCQNREISRGSCGIQLSVHELANEFLSLKNRGAHNINLVTPTHYIPSIREAVAIARERGLNLPIVYNTSSYETSESLDIIRDSVDVWLPDLKYYKKETSSKYSFANDLPDVSRRAIEKMVSFAPEAKFSSDGIMTSGVIVRILLLPGHVAEAKLNLKYLADSFGDKIYISLMSQYTPIGDMPAPLDRRVTRREYSELVDYAVKLGIENAFIQDISSASDVYIPKCCKGEEQ